MAKAFVFLTALLATAFAEPPVDSSYLPPGRGMPAGQYGPPSANSFGGRTPASTSYLPPSNGLDSYNGRKGGSGAGGYPSQLSNTYGAPFQDQGANGFGADSITVDAASRFGGSSYSRRPSGSYGAPARSGANGASSRFGQPSQSYGAPSASGFGAPSFGARSSYSASSRSAQPSSTYGAPGGLSATYGAPSRSAQPSRRYNAPSASSFRSNGFGSQPSSSYGAPRSQGASRYTSATPSNTYGTPFNGALDNSFGAPSGSYGAPSSSYGAPSNGFGTPSNSYSAPSSTYGAPSNGIDSQFSRQLSSEYGAPRNGNGNGYANGNGYGYGKKSTTEDPLAEPANYEYTYEVRDEESPSGAEFGHQESREDEFAKGVYHVLLPDGRMQIVEYEADEEGYRPQIRYEETGYPDARSGQNGQGGY